MDQIDKDDACISVHFVVYRSIRGDPRCRVRDNDADALLHLQCFFPISPIQRPSYTNPCQLPFMQLMRGLHLGIHFHVTALELGCLVLCHAENAVTEHNEHKEVLARRMRIWMNQYFVALHPVVLQVGCCTI